MLQALDLALDSRLPGSDTQSMAGTSIVAPVSDEDLAERIARRDESPRAAREAREACTLLYERHARRLLAFLATRLPRHELEDVHQELWVRVWDRLPRTFQRGNFRAWLYQISRNYLIDRSRRRHPDAIDPAMDVEGPASLQPEEILVERELMMVLRQCLTELREDVAELVRARLAGETYETICPRLGLKSERAHRLFHGAKEQLQKCVSRAIP